MRQIDSVRKFARNFDSALESVRSEEISGGGALETVTIAKDADKALEVLRGDSDLESFGLQADIESFGALEAIVPAKLRPPYLILGDKIEIEGDYDHIDLVKLGRSARDVASVSDNGDNILKYRHFSVIQSASLRLPLVTSVNIDGERSFKLKRKGDWRLDGRALPSNTRLETNCVSATRSIAAIWYASAILAGGRSARKCRKPRSTPFTTPTASPARGSEPKELGWP